MDKSKKRGLRNLSIASACAALIGCVAFAGASIVTRVEAATEGYSGTTDRHNWPKQLMIVENYAQLNSYYSGIVTYQTSDAEIHISTTADLFEGILVPAWAKVSFDYDLGTMSLEAVGFAKYAWPSGGLTDATRVEFRKAVEFSPLPCFAVYSPSYDTQYVYCYRANMVSYFSSMEGSSNAPANDVLQLPNLFTAGRYFWVTGYPGQVPLYLDGGMFTDIYETMVFTLVANLGSSDAYATGYNYGYDVGRSDGFDQGYTTGYREGQTAMTEDGEGLNNLFGAVVSVPISIFNGLSAFTVWGFPIITIGLTFLAFGLIMYVVKKVI